MEGTPPTDQATWGSVAAHPLRVALLRRLRRAAASPRQLAAEFGKPLGMVAYHVRQLKASGQIKLIAERPRRGSIEHVYAAVGFPPSLEAMGHTVCAVVHRLDERATADVSQRLAIMAAECAKTLDAAAWSVSILDTEHGAVRGVTWVHSSLDPASGERRHVAAASHRYRVRAYPQTRRALQTGDGFYATREAPETDRAQRDRLARLGYQAVLATPATSPNSQFLVELYADERSPELATALDLLRVLTHYAATARTE